jgi:hypothetical protein
MAVKGTGREVVERLVTAPNRGLGDNCIEYLGSATEHLLMI